MREYLKFLTESMKNLTEDATASPLYSMVASKDITKPGHHAIMMDDLNIYDSLQDEDFEDGFVIQSANQEEETIDVIQKIDLSNLLNMVKRINPEATKEDVKATIEEFIRRIPYKLNKRIDQNGTDIRGYYQLENIEDSTEEGNYLVLHLRLGLVQPTGMDRVHPEEKNRWQKGVKVGKTADVDSEEPEDYEPSQAEIEAAKEAELSYQESKRFLDKLIKD